MNTSTFSNQRRGTFGLFLAVWTVIAVVAATTTFIGLGGQSFADWFSIFGVMAEYFYTWGLISIAVYWLLRSQDRWWSTLAAQIPIHLSLLVAISVLMPFWVHGESWRSWLYGDRAAGFHSLNAFVYAVILLGGTLWRLFRQGREREAEVAAARLREVELETLLERTRMDALRAQMNPHFLFNTLNSIASLVESAANKAAYQVIESLAELLRRGLDYSQDNLATVRDELHFLNAYVEIEKVRFADRLSISISVPEECLDLDVPSFTLQPLVENVVKHGVSQSSRSVNVDVQIARVGGHLQISVADDGPGLQAGSAEGVGLSNLGNRLRHLFGTEATLSIRNNGRGGATVDLALPIAASVAARTNPATRNRDRTQDSTLDAAADSLG